MKRLFFLATLLCACADPQAGDWGLGAITSMKTPADSPSLGCGVTIPVDTGARERANCAFGTGAHAAQSLDIPPEVAAAIPIRHVIVMMKENRSFDHLLGEIANVPPEYSNPDLTGNAVFPFHADTTCIQHDPGHQYQSVQDMLDGGRMDGFVKNAARTSGTDGSFVMSHYTSADLPFYYFLANTYALNDRHFAPLATGTFANRAYFMLGTNAGIVDTGIEYPPPSTPSIMQLMMNAGYTWGSYTDGPPFDGALGWSNTAPGVHSIDELLAALDAGTLPNLAFVDAELNIEDDHPTADLQTGEAFFKKIYDHAVASPQWERMAILWTYDEAGGFADHVTPPVGACPPDPTTPDIAGRGPRISMVAISPWAKRAYLSHTVEDHTAITRFVETIFDLPALTGRDANMTALLDLFDFSCHDLSVPPAPDAGTGGCH
jgi:phospholipase C